MASKQFELPDLGEGIAEGELVSWLVDVGDDVEADQTIAEVETDKALVEVPSPYDGTVTELHAGEGETVPVDSVIATFEVAEDPTDAGEAESEDGSEADSADGEVDAEAAGESGTGAERSTERVAGDESDTGDAGSAEAGGDAGGGDAGGGDETPSGVTEPAGERVFAAPSTRTLARELGVDLATVSGSGQGGRVTAADVRAAADSAAPPADGTSAAGGTGGGGGSTTDSEAVAGGVSRDASPAEPKLVESEGAARDRTLAMPATRELAREAGVDINDVPASEQRSGEAYVTPADVRAYVESGGAAAAPAGESAAGAGASASAGGGEGGRASGASSGGASSGGVSADGPSAGERVPYTGIRRTIGEQMARSKYTAPHVAHHDEFDAADLVDVREDLASAAEQEGVNLTYLPFVVRAVTRALQEFPYLNSSLDEDAGEIVLHDEYNVGIAVATDDGLLVPVVKHADEKGLVELAAEIDDLATRARNRELAREEMQGGTFTITNIGVVGGEFSAPIINHPEAAILAMGPIRKRPWVVDDDVVARETMRLSMSVDHRLVDGAEAAQFTNRVQELLGQPARLLL